MAAMQEAMQRELQQQRAGNQAMLQEARQRLEALQAQTQATSATAGAAVPAASGVATAMWFRFENVPVDTILEEVSRHFGIITLKTVPMPARITVTVQNQVTADEAVQLLNNILFSQGYGLIESATSGPNPQRVLRIAPITEVKKANIPVYNSADPNTIKFTDNIITQIIPLKTLSAVRLRNDMLSLFSADADVTANAESNCIIITDTSAKIHKIVEVISTLDKVATDRPTPAPAAPVGSGRGSPGVRPGEIPYVMSMVVDGAAMQFRQGDILGEVFCSKADIATPAGGILAKVSVKEGQSVKAGQVLAEFDGSAARAEMQAAEARLQMARAKIPAGAAGPGEMERAKAEVVAEEAAVSLCRQKLDALQIKSPLDGSVTTMDFSAGQYVPAGTVLTQVVGTGDLKLSFRLAFNDRTRLKVGQKITFAVGDKIPAFPAEITYISPTTDSSNRTEIRARFTGPTGVLIPGVLGTVAIPEL